jgi:membrane-associated phospholipid phosphatase
VFLFGGFAIASWIADDHGTWKVAYEIAQSTLYAGGLNFIVKTAIGRARPYDEDGPKSFSPFKGFFVNTAHQSLPGGHCVVAFALSTVFSRNVKSGWLKGIAYVPAALTFVARVYQDHHWTSDDFAGAAIGYFVATWVVDQHEEGESRIHISSPFPLTISIRLN